MTLSTFVPDPMGAGGLLTIFLNGSPLATWDGMGLNGEWVPNGHYHFVLEVDLGSGQEVILERDAYIGPRGKAVVSLTASPNVSTGGAIVLSGSLSGIPADGQSRIKLYTVGGELLRTLVPSLGTVSWDLRSASGKAVASGVYLAVLEGPGPTGDLVRGVVKVLVVR
jgi:hypothetical protein